MPAPLRVIDDSAGNALRNPPHNYEAERSLLGAILMNNRAFDQVAEFLHYDHFADPVNGRIYKACAELLAQDRAASPVTLKSYLEHDDLMLAAGGMKYLGTIASSAVTFINAREYGRLIYDLFLRREMIFIGQELVENSYSMSVDTPAAAIQEAHEARLTALSIGDTQGSSLVMLKDAVNDTIQRWEKSSRDGEVGLSYGLPSLDYRAGMLEDGTMVVIGGRPSMGKTALARQVGIDAARRFKETSALAGTAPKHVLMFSAEMSERAQAGAVLTGATGIRRPRRRDALTQIEIETLVARGADFDLPFIFDPTPGVTLAHMRSAARKVQRMPGGLGLIILDYLQLMGLERGVQASNEVARVTYLSRGFKELCRVLNVPGIALSQLSRAVEQRENKRPQLSDLRESGAIEQDADVIAFVYRDEYYLERDPPQRRDNEGDEQFNKRSVAHQMKLEAAAGKAEVIVAKARLDAIGTAHLLFDGPTMAFRDPRSHRDKDGPPPGHPAGEQMPFELDERAVAPKEQG